MTKDKKSKSTNFSKNLANRLGNNVFRMTRGANKFWDESTQKARDDSWFEEGSLRQKSERNFRADLLCTPFMPVSAIIEAVTFVPVVLPISAIQAIRDTKQAKTEEIARCIPKNVIENYLKTKKQDPHAEVEPALYKVLDRLSISNVEEIFKDKKNQENTAAR